MSESLVSENRTDGITEVTLETETSSPAEVPVTSDKIVPTTDLADSHETEDKDKNFETMIADVAITPRSDDVEMTKVSEDVNDQNDGDGHSISINSGEIAQENKQTLQTSTTDLLQVNEDSRCSVQSVTSSRSKPALPASAASATCDLIQVNEDSRSSVQSVTSSRSIDPILKQGSLFSSINAMNLIEYQWPADDSGEYYMIQEQISSFLGITSFKRKYPDIDRHKLGPQELNHLMLKMLVSEVQVTLGLTAVRSRDVCDLMMKEYPEKFNEYIVAQDEKKKESIKGKHQQYSTPTVEKSQLPNYMKKAMKQVSAYNVRLNRRRKEEYGVYYDMQTNVLQFPKWKYSKLHPDFTRPSLYPCSLIPGQFQEFCQKYTADELGYFPLNTAIYGPPPPLPEEISELMKDSASDSESIADAEDDEETADKKAERIPDEKEEGSEREEKDEEPEKSPPSPKEEESEINEDNSNSNDSVGSKDQGIPVKDSESTNNSVVTKEELMQNYIDDPDKPMCGLCLRDETSNKKGEPEDLISCSQCDNYGHPSCLDMSKELVSVIVTYNWQCLECKTCTYCNKPHHEDKMMFCDRCDRGYHTFCVGLRNLPSGLWMCPQCTRSDPDFAKKGGGRKRGPRKRKLSTEKSPNADETPKPKRKRRTKKEMEEAREKERMEKEEKIKRKMERKAEKHERRRRRRLRKEQKAAAAAAAEGENEQNSSKEGSRQDASQENSEVISKDSPPSRIEEPTSPKSNSDPVEDNTFNQEQKDDPKPDTAQSDVLTSETKEPEAMIKEEETEAKEHEQEGSLS